MTALKDFELLPGSVLRDAAFLIGLIGPHVRRQLYPVPVEVHGFQTIALCIRARGKDGEMGLHPVAIVPHQRMAIFDIRDGTKRDAHRIGKVDPVDRDHARLMLEAISDPNEFFATMNE